jgi:hypothetical protein
LSLSPTQRTDIRQALERHWEERWYAAIDALHEGNQYLPFIHLICLYPHIDNLQRSVWREKYAEAGSLWQALGFASPTERDNTVMIDAELGPLQKAGQMRVSNDDPLAP